MTDRMKTFVINGVPYRMRGDMKLPNYKSDFRSRDPLNDPPRMELRHLTRAKIMEWPEEK